MQGQIQWNRNLQREDDGVTTTLTLSCRPTGAIHLETPASQGGFSADYQNPNEAAQALTGLFEQGIGQAKHVS